QSGLQRVEQAQDRMWRHLDFVRTRSGSYLGSGIALTHLADGTRMLINANDDGCPMGILSGGRHEENNTQLLLSFVDPDTVLVDIGANIGFFSVSIAQRLTGRGHVHAFEPHPS